MIQFTTTKEEGSTKFQMNTTSCLYCLKDCFDLPRVYRQEQQLCYKLDI